AMKIEDGGLLMRRIEQIEQGNANGAQFIAQPQTSQPERGKRSTCHDQRLNHQQRIGIGPDEIEERDGKEDWFKVDGKARDASNTIAVRIAYRIANSLMKQLAVRETPDGLVHNTQVFCTR